MLNRLLTKVQQKNSSTTKQKKTGAQVLKYSSKNLHRLNKKLNLERTMSELGKNQIKNQWQNATCEKNH